MTGLAYAGSRPISREVQSAPHQSRANPDLSGREPLPTLGDASSPRLPQYGLHAPVFKGGRGERRLFDQLGAYVVKSGCYEMVEDLVQRVLIVQPAPAHLLQFLVSSSRENEVAAQRALLAETMAAGKLLTEEEMNILRDGDLELEEGWPGGSLGPVVLKDRPRAGAAQRLAWRDYVHDHRVHALLRELLHDVLRAQPAKPHAFCTNWLEEKLMQQPPEELEDLQLSTLMETPRPGDATSPRLQRAMLQKKLLDGHMLTAEEMQSLKDLEAEERANELAQKLAEGHMLTAEEQDELQQMAAAERAGELAQKLAEGHMLSAEEQEEVEQMAAAERAGELAQKLAEGHMLSAEEQEELQQLAEAAEVERANKLAQKLAGGHMLTAEEQEELEQLAAQQDVEAAAATPRGYEVSLDA